MTSLFRNCFMQLFFLFFSMALHSESRCQSPSNHTTTSNAATISQPTAAADISGKLDILVVDMDSFKRLEKRKLVLAFTINDQDKLTLHGWSFRGLFIPDFKISPNIKLENNNPSDVDFGRGTYFVNFILNGVGRIRRGFRKPGYKYVFFVPEVIKGEGLHYWIIGSKDPTLIYPLNEKQRLAAYLANPSPPKNR